MKTKLFFCLVLFVVLFLSVDVSYSQDKNESKKALDAFINATTKGAVDPVSGAEVYIELEPDDEPLVNVTTDENGEFYFETANVPNFPEQGVLVMTIIPSKAYARSKDISVKKPQKIRVDFKIQKGEKLKFILFWEEPNVKSKKGFAVSGRNTA